jgi:hypothetical protein
MPNAEPSSESQLKRLHEAKKELLDATEKEQNAEEIQYYIPKGSQNHNLQANGSLSEAKAE